MWYNGNPWIGLLGGPFLIITLECTNIVRYLVKNYVEAFNSTIKLNNVYLNLLF